MAPGSARPLQGGRTDVGHVLGFAVAYAAAMTIARSFGIGTVVLSFVWPACGIATLWLLFARSRRVWVVDVAVLGAVTALVNAATGLAVGLSVWFGAVNVLQAVLGAALLRRLTPQLWGCGGRESFTRVSSISNALVAAVVSSTAAALSAAPVLALSGADVSVESVLLHISRNTYGFFAVVTVIHLLLWTVRFGRTDPDHDLVGGPSVPEGVALLTVTAALYVTVYFGPVLPVAWVPLIVTIWGGLRFSPLAVAAQSTLGAGIAFAATLTEHGPLTISADPAARAWLLQGVLTVTLMSGLALAASRSQLLALLRQVDAERRSSEQTNDLMATTLGALRAGLLVVSTEGEVELANGPARDLLERRLLGTQGLEPDASTWDELWQRTLQSHGVAEFDAYVADGFARRVLHVHAVPLERTGGLVVHLADVTAQQDSRDELVGFAAHAAHDLRGPLMAVRGWLDLLRIHLDQGTLRPEEARLIVSRATNTADRMTVLLNDLVDHAAGEGEQLSLDRVDLREVVRSAAEQTGVGGAVFVGALPTVQGDRTMLNRVALNLLGNSLKYADPERELTVDVTCRQLPSGEVETRFQDNGSGIPPHELERVFEPFHRATSVGTGNGMGLSMCRQIVARHGGTIYAEGNGPEPGTTIVMTLPLDDAAPTTPTDDHDTLRTLGLLVPPQG